MFLKNRFGFDQGNLKSILEGIGFDRIESETFYYDEKIVGENKIEYSLFFVIARGKSKD